MAKKLLPTPTPILDSSTIVIPAGRVLLPAYSKNLSLIQEVLKANPLNTNELVVAQKIAVIDCTNSTNLSKQQNKVALSDLAKIIVTINNFDDKVKNGELDLVNEIADKTKKLGANLFSLASKYCHYHNNLIYGKDDFSIFDTILTDNLVRYDPRLTPKIVRSFKENFKYADYSKAIESILLAKNINVPFKRKLFDQFIWGRAI